MNVPKRVINFQTVVLSILLVNACLAAPGTLPMATSGNIPIRAQPMMLRHDHVYDANGQFALAYAMDDGTSQAKQGIMVLNEKGDDYVMEQKGSYSYISPEGVPVKMSYTAGKDGFVITDPVQPTN